MTLTIMCWWNGK